MEATDVTVEEIENELARWLFVKNDKPLAENGWFTAGTMADEAHCSYARANQILNKGVSDGEVELKMYGKIKYYRLKRKDGHILASGT